MGQCPSNFRTLGFGCVSECPTQTGFEFQNENGQPRCVYKERPENFVNLNPIESIIRRDGTRITEEQLDYSKGLESIPEKAIFPKYKAEYERVASEIAIILGKIGKDKQLKDAFQKLQEAENARDQAPDAYQRARSTYYILKDGETWQTKESERLLKSEVEPIANKYAETKTAALRQYENQRKTVDVVNGLKDKVLTLKDEVKYAADTFKDQLGKVQNAIIRERRVRTANPQPTIWEWLDTLLNVVIIGALLFVVYALYKKLSTRTLIQPAVILRG